MKIISSASELLNWVDTFEEGLFYRVSRQIVSFVDGIGICTVMIEFNEPNDCLDFTIPNKENPKTPYKISVPLPRIFKHIDHLGMFSEIFDEELYAIKNKHLLIEKLICSYVKKHLAVCILETDEFTNAEIKTSKNSIPTN